LNRFWEAKDQMSFIVEGYDCTFYRIPMDNSHRVILSLNPDITKVPGMRIRKGRNDSIAILSE